MEGSREAGCYPEVLVGVNSGLAFVDAVIAVLSFTQLLRIHSRNAHVGWTRQKVFHVMIGLSNLGYFLYFVLAPVAACDDWVCWSQSCGFFAMACPKILFLGAFLLLLSFWVDLCHQSNGEEDDDDDEGYSPQESLLDKTKPYLDVDSHTNCCSFHAIHVGSRQKVVILVTFLVFVLMLTASALIWIGRGENPIDSSVVARVYVDLFSISVLLLGAALACYGLVLFLRMRKVRSERASSEMWKVAGLASVSILCFSSSAFVAIFTDIPLLYHWHGQPINSVSTPLLLVLYYFLGSSVPSAFVLWVMREMPPPLVRTQERDESRTLAFIGDTSVTVHPQRWTAVASMQNQVSRASPI
ncbi:unnamed protein product [Cuscuta campestris]|uniref:THH1/TOM1/TOM3 domain-containing protein n=1 Tax=Cuscuta campestris TaxID=132261 RepID=A0A484LYC5_9ASTE|nr:unnamed protein product [Cuscuta campestris]